MGKSLQQKLHQGITLFLLMFCSLISYSQTTSLTMSMQNAVQTAPNIIEYDVMITNTGTTSLAVRGYSSGINHAAGMNNGGTITHSFVSRDPMFAGLTAVSAGYTAATNHIRMTTTNASPGNEVTIPSGIPVRVATMRLTSTVNFPVDFNPSFSMQSLTAPGKTQCIVTAIVTPPGTNYAINGIGNNPASGTLQALTATTSTPCFFLNPSGIFSAATTSTTSVLCYGQSTGSATIALSNTGSAAPTGTTGTYTINGGTAIPYTGNPFTISNLAGGVNTIVVTTSYGCIGTTTATISQPSTPFASSFSASFCTGTYTLPWGTIVSVAGAYTHTYTAANGCDSVVTATISAGNVSINPLITATACDSYTWNVSGLTYTVSGTYMASFLNVAGCDSNHTLDIIVNQSSSATSSVSACHSYTWAQNGTTYTASGTYVSTGVNAQGCPHTETLQLIINYTSTSSSSVSVLGSYMWSANGQTYTSSGVFTHVLTNGYGCDSTLTLHLTVLVAATTMTLQNVVQTAANVFQYDVMLVNTGTAALALRGYSFGITHAAGMNGAGSITHTYISRDPSLASLTSVFPGYTASSNHLRATTVIATPGNEVQLAVGVPVRLATMRVTTSASSFPADFDPQFSLQTINASGKTSCLATCIVTPPGLSFVLNGTANALLANTLNVLTGVVNTPCFYLSPTSLFALNTISTTICAGQTTSDVTVTLSGTGSAGAGVYSLDGGVQMAYASGPLVFNNLSVGTHTIAVTAATGCSGTSVITLAALDPIVTFDNVTACNSYTFLGSTYTVSTSVSNTYTASSGCDSVHTLHLTINYSNASTSSAYVCDSYVWNGTTYTTSGAYTTIFTNAAGCDSVHTLNLSINYSNASTSSAYVCDSYVWNGTTYTTSGAYTTIFTNAAGCDSTHILTLVINQPTSSGQTITAYNTYTWPANNLTYTIGGVYTHVLNNANGCDSNLTLNLTILIEDTLNLKVFIQGYYLGASEMTPAMLNQGESLDNTITDTIFVELRDALSPSTVLNSTYAILHTDGMGSVSFPHSSSPFYIVVKHRNALQTWSAIPVQFNSTSMTYDFTTSSSQAYGDNMIEVEPGIWALYAGDLNSDENIDLIDGIDLEEAVGQFLFGYVDFDINGDGNVDLLDQPDVEINVNNFIYSIHP